MGWAQHPFYLQMLEDGKLAFSQQEWHQAAVNFEIAAFGFLEKDELLAQAFVLQTLAHSELQQIEQQNAAMRDAEQVLEILKKKPAGLQSDHWERYLVVSGKKAPPRPPVPTDSASLTTYVATYPDSAPAWEALLANQIDTGKPVKVRGLLNDAKAALPQNTEILRLALLFAAKRDKGRGAQDVATKLLILKPDSPIANEYSGNLAVAGSDWQAAQSFFRFVDTPQLPNTQANISRLSNELQRQAQAEAEAKAKQLEQATQTPEINTPDTTTSQETSQALEPTPVEPEVVQPEEEDVALALEAAEKRQAALEAEAKIAAKQALDNRIKTLERAVRSDATRTDLGFDLIDAYVSAESYDKARKLLGRMARRHNQNIRYAETYAHYQYAMGNYQANISNLKAFEKPTPAMAYYLGMSHYKLGQIEKAKSIIGSLKDSNYDIPADLIDSGQDKLGSGAMGLRNTGTITQMSQDQAISWLEAKSAEENWQEISRQMGAIQAKFPTQPDVRFYQGRMHMANNNNQLAMPIFIELVSEGYTQNEIFYFAGLTAFRQGNMSVAQYLLERAKANNSKYSAEINDILTNKIKPN